MILAGMILTGCTGTPAGTVPDVPGQTTGSTPAGTEANGAASQPPPAAGGRQSATPGTSTGPGAGPIAGPGSGPGSGPSSGQSAAQKSFVKADSVPFPVAVGNTWVYQTMTGRARGRTTNQIVAAGPGPAAYQVTVSSTTDVGAAASAQPVYRFYPDGAIGYALPPGSGVSVPGGGVRWPGAAGLASGRAYHSVLRVQDSQTGQYENANVTVRGGGTTYLVVPGGAFQTSVVDMTIVAKTVTVEVINWIAQGIGPVETEVITNAAGKAQRSITYELLSFTKGISVVGDGS